MAGDLRIGILGGVGRMGLMNLREVTLTKRCIVAGVAVRPGSNAVGQDAGECAGIGLIGVTVVDDPREFISNIDVLIDFTLPEVSVKAADLASQAKVALVVGTTGFSEEQEQKIAEAASCVPIVRAANTSVAVTLLTALAEQAAQTLGIDYDIEVIEMHHRYKVDAPSGTALALGEALARGRGINLSDVKQAARDGYTGPRKAGDIGFASLRGGDVAGEHEIIFATDGERLTLGHQASNRQVFAIGAVRAAVWAPKQIPGLYSMRNVLGFKD